MVGSGPNQAESMGSQHQDHFHNLEQRRDREGSVHTTQTTKSHTHVGSHVSQRQNNNQAMQQEIDDLKKKLCYA